MRALLLPLALAACTPAAGGQADNMTAAMNAIEAAADAVEGGASEPELMDLGNDVMDMDMIIGNSTEPARPSPAWMAGGTWLYAAEDVAGAVWYFEGLESDFTVRPHRVLLRTDERYDPNSRRNNSERLAEIDCAGHRYRILRTTHYDGAGRATEADERGDGRMAPVAPGSVFAQVEESVCRHAAEPSGPSVMNGM